MLQKNDFNEIFDILLEKLKQLKSSESIADKESSKSMLHKIVLILTKINETILSDFKNLPGDNKASRSNSDININNIQKLKESNYFEDSESDENIKKEAAEENSKSAETNMTEIYLSFLEIHEKSFPLFLEFYANEHNRPKRKIASTYKNTEIEILGTLNISIMELIKSFFDFVLVNSKQKALGFKNLSENLFSIEEKFRNKLKHLFEIMFSHNFFKVCFNDLLRYEMNNHLQILINHMITSILDYSASEINQIVVDQEENKFKNVSEILITHLFIEIDLLNFILFNTLDKTIEFDNTKKVINAGFTPCLIEIAEKINIAKSENKEIKKILETSKNNFNKKNNNFILICKSKYFYKFE